MATDNVDCDNYTVREGVKAWMESVRSNATPAFVSSSLEYHNVPVKILGHTSVLRRLFPSYRNGNKIITLTSIPILSLLRISQYLLSFQKRCRYKHDYNILILRDTVVFGNDNSIEVLLSPKSSLYDFSHAAIRLGNLLLGDVIL